MGMDICEALTVLLPKKKNCVCMQTFFPSHEFLFQATILIAACLFFLRDTLVVLSPFLYSVHPL